ncbi:hypothetical protein CEP54_005630 [Fusarium duplospermum]|uniref:DUF7779 domain-containing protein n=1 Tax=Fusarium duplospermum TaxID=1325734 RepID=A0A428QBW0_9HYPO|nr:hypothetical protein CEP54_005630 [Fusarium duplospermum]
MDENEKQRGIDPLFQLLLCFQCQRVPLDLINRACVPKSSWSATGEIEQIQPHEGGVPRWLIDYRETHQPLFDHNDGTAAACLDGLQLVKDCGVWYLEIQSTDSFEADEDEQSQQTYASQCIRIFNHAFPCRNTEVLGEEVAASLIPLAKAFLLPLLASVSEKDIQDWLLPKERSVEFTVSLFGCLQHILTLLGLDSPLNPTAFPRKMLNVLSPSTAEYREAEPCLKIFLAMVETVSSSSVETFEGSILNSDGDLDERPNAWKGLSLGMLLSSQNLKRQRSRYLSNAITRVSTQWRPKSETSPSPMEYLVSIELLSHAQLEAITLPDSLSIELSILRGLLLSRMQYHQEASRALYAILPSAISHWGLASFQVGIVGAESASCYNMLRKEDVANTIATRCLAARRTPELTSRQDWFYLSLHLVDSLIGRGRYAEAEPVIQHILSQPLIAPIIHMMACLRLSKISRRAPGEFKTVFESHHALQEGIGVFRQVPSALQEEFLEEFACILSAKGSAQKSLEAQKVLVDGVNGLLGQMLSRKGPAQERYARAQLDFSQHFRQQENYDGMSEDEISPELPAPSVDDDPCMQESIGSHVIDDTIPIATQKVFSITYERDDDFVPVPTVFELTHDPLLDDNIHIYSIYGQAGIGKSSFVADFARKSRYHYSFILWIKDAPLEEILAYLSTVAAQLGLKNANSSMPIPPEQALEQMFRWLTHPRNTSSRVPWLIVFDGIESEEILRQLWPTRGRFGTILVITRRRPRFLNRFNGDTPRYIEVEGLWAPAHTIEWAYRHMNVRRPTLSNRKLPSRKDMVSLLELLQYHPAAIKQATSLISRHDIGIGDFITAFEKVRDSIKKPLVSQILLEPNHSIQLIIIWLITPMDNEPLMNLISLLDSLDVPESLLWPNASFPWVDGYPRDVSEFEDMRNQLLESSLIWRVGGQRRISTSPALQAILKDRMDEAGLLRACCGALFLLCRAWPCKFEDSTFIAYMTPTLTECCNLQRHASELHHSLRRLYSSPRSLRVASQVLDALLDISCKDFSLVKVNLGLSLLLNDQPEAAEKVLEQAQLQDSATGLGDDVSNSQRTLGLFLGPAIAKLSQNKPEESLQLALNNLGKLPATSSEKNKAAIGFHLVASGSYGRLSEFDLAQ